MNLAGNDNLIKKENIVDVCRALKRELKNTQKEEERKCKEEEKAKRVLVDIVKLAQKRGLKGLSDPSKRSHEVLAAFLKTFSKEEELKFFDNIMRHHLNQYMLERLKDKSHDSPEQGWIVINFKNKPKVIKSTEMVVVDCEMVLCEDETEALEELVKPNKEIADYRTKITGVSSQDLEAVTCSMADIQKYMNKLLSSGIILVGHSLPNDLLLKLDHVKVINTSYIFQSLDGSIHKRPSLNSLCQASNKFNCCLDDAKAAMDLVLAKIKHGVDKEFPIALVQEHVSKSELAKLLLHKIPNTVNIETLHKILPGDFKIELKLGSVSYEYLNVMRRGLLPSRKGQGASYSAFAIFKSPQEADEAYENVQGSQLKLYITYEAPTPDTTQTRTRGHLKC
ncbi:Small RNA degrading nuclease 3 [Glycine max]|nr:Small RNA degrading nuclease 3 [Glycine max]